MNVRLIKVLFPLILLPLLTGCDLSTDAPRQLPEPHFDARAIFASAEGDDSDGGPGDITGQGFEERIREAMHGDDDTATGEESPRSLRTVPVGRALVSEIPDDHEVWRWSRSGSTTLISKMPPGEPPRALFLATNRHIGPASLAMRTFIGDVDPALTAEYGIPFSAAELSDSELGDEAGDADGDDLSSIDLLSLLGAGASLTGGRGIGYRSHPDTFTGWRWMGRSDEGLFWRIASTRGRWGAQPSMTDFFGPALDKAIEDLGLKDELFEELDMEGELEGWQQVLAEGGAAAALDRDRPESPFANRPPQTAQLFFGEVEDDSGRVMTIALLCAAEPHCSGADEFVHFFNRLRSDHAPGSAHETDFDEHTESLGIELGR